MPTEIERKFLVTNASWKARSEGIQYRQGFLSTDRHRTVRVRIGGDKAYLTVKGLSRGFSRPEFEYPIPVEDARLILDGICLKPLIEKTRYKVSSDGLIWEIDVFEGENQGLILAEVELNSEDQEIERPPWLGEEVTGDPRYYNANLIANPFKNWSK